MILVEVLHLRNFSNAWKLFEDVAESFNDVEEVEEEEEVVLLL